MTYASKIRSKNATNCDVRNSAHRERERKKRYFRINFDTVEGKLEIHKQIKINIK
jgi:hypothetical protein